MENDHASRAAEPEQTEDERRKALWVAFSRRHERAGGGDIERGHGQKIVAPIEFTNESKRSESSKSERRSRKKSKKRKWGSGGKSLMGAYSKRSSGQRFGR